MGVEYALVFRVDVADLDVARDRLRGLLKVALRAFGMSSVTMAEERVVAVDEMRAADGQGRGFVCPEWRSEAGQGRFWWECGRARRRWVVRWTVDDDGWAVAFARGVAVPA